MGSHPDLKTNHALREQLRNKARLLKTQGDSISVICETLGVAQSTVGGWVVGMNEEPAMLKYCELCGDAFLAYRKDLVRCPQGCNDGSKPPWRIREKKPRYCVLCKGQIKRPGKTKFCCPEHKAEYEAPPPRYCLFCEVEIVGRRSHAKFCCREHLDLHHHEKRSPPKYRQCAWCHETFERTYRQTYCCVEHRQEAIKENRKKKETRHPVLSVA